MKQVWYVKGDPNAYDKPLPYFFDTKEGAERYARLVFPDEPIDQRYARLHFAEVLTVSQL